MKVEALTLDEVLPVRHAVLWPNELVAFCRVAEDEAGEHFGVRQNGEVICVASVFLRATRQGCASLPPRLSVRGRGLALWCLSF
ncbi:hypothetical protein [Zobellella taiwanensis]|uniref:hypothetical protein n=1 Tax=Zobellella taiwanensis TaxID=347535 RepID=UPI001FE2CDF6|nr:hypothetical protein [Zobellella taiwanensis]